MSYAPPALVVAPPRVPLPYGLFSVVTPREGSQDRWQAGGIQFEGIGCPREPDSAPIIALDCEDPEGLPKTFESNGHIFEAQTFAVYESEVCSPIGNGLERSQEIARARLELFEERYLEEHLWSLFSGTAKEWEVQGDTLDEMIEWLVNTVAEADGYAIYGSQGVLHLSRYWASIGLKAKMLESRQGRLYTTLGTPVIAGSGYGSTHVYLTPQLVAYRDAIITGSKVEGDLLDRGENNLYGLAERMWVIGYELDCDHLPEVDPDPEPGSQ